MARIFAYTVHRGGAPDDTAAELLAAANKIDAAATPTAVVLGWGAELDAVCATLRASYAEVWKMAHESQPAFRRQRLAALNRIFAREAALKVAEDGWRWVVGAAGVSDSEMGAFETALGLPAVHRAQAHCRHGLRCGCAVRPHREEQSASRVAS